MSGSAQRVAVEGVKSGAFARNARASFIGSKIIQSVGVDADRLDVVHNAMWIRLINENADAPIPKDECDQLAAHIVAVARVADEACAEGGSRAAMAAVMRESGRTIDPLIAQNFLRLASSSIFWMALDSAGQAQVR
jgi:hypothetical protein